MASKIDYTFRMKAMSPTADEPGGTARIVDSKNLPRLEYHCSGPVYNEARGTARASLASQRFGVAVLHRGSGRMTVFASAGRGPHDGLQTK